MFAVIGKPSCSKVQEMQKYCLPYSSMDLRLRWGALVGAPHFATNPKLTLEKKLLENWQGLLFKGPRYANADLAGMRFTNAFDFTGYRLDRVELHECNYNWKTFIEVYLETTMLLLTILDWVGS